MIRWRRALLAAGLAALLALALLPGGDRQFDYARWSATVRTGDVVMLAGTGWRSRLVRLFGRHETEFSHTGLAEVENGRVFLLHADPERGCVRDDLAGLFARKIFSAAAAYAPAPADGAARAQAVRFAEDAAGAKVGFNGTFKFGAEQSKLYCTELVIRAYQQAGVALLPSVTDAAVIFPDALVRAGGLRGRD
jgi:hypothetical protein